MVLVDGWLTWPGRAVVTYDPAAVSGLRFPWGIPVEDHGFGWALVTWTVLTWVGEGARDRPHPGLDSRAASDAAAAAPGD